MGYLIDCSEIFKKLGYEIVYTTDGVVFADPPLTTNQQIVVNEFIKLNFKDSDDPDFSTFKTWCQNNYPGIYAALLSAWNEYTDEEDNKAAWKVACKENSVPANWAAWVAYWDGNAP